MSAKVYVNVDNSSACTVLCNDVTVSYYFTWIESFTETLFKVVPNDGYRIGSIDVKTLVTGTSLGGSDYEKVGADTVKFYASDNAEYRISVTTVELPLSVELRGNLDVIGTVTAKDGAGGAVFAYDAATNTLTIKEAS